MFENHERIFEDFKRDLIAKQKKYFVVDFFV